MQWIQENWAIITTVILAVIRFAESIAELTPSQRDDEIIAKIKAILGNFFTLGTGK